MKILPITWDDVSVQIETLGVSQSDGPTSTSYGIASFPPGVRHPAEGFSAHEGTEISFILDGEFDVETPDGTVTVGKDHLVVIPAGEPHATIAKAHGRVAFFLISEVQE
tara:strand:- start:312 stop:638 length:327 start_codon:yes stop_codon:yes gene_type:complete